MLLVGVSIFLSVTYQGKKMCMCIANWLPKLLNRTQSLNIKECKIELKLTYGGT